MRFWLAKSEPGEYSWEDLQRDKKSSWDGIRNYQARNFMKEMEKGDRVFLYHSGEEKAIVGWMEVSKTASPDPSAEKGEDWVVVEFKALKKAARPLSLGAMKSDPVFSDMLLIRQSRLSVSPVSKKEADHILKLTGLGD